MGLSLSTARFIAPASFLFDFAMQQYGMSYSKPNMLDVHNANPAAFSPYAWAIPAFFAPQQIIQLVWLYRLIFAKDASAEELEAATSYTPWYALGNICIGLWLPFWNSENMWLAQTFVTINSLSQLYYYYTSLPRSLDTKWTRWNNTLFAGIGILDFLHNGAIAVASGVAPNLLTQTLTGAGFAVSALTTDLLMGVCLAYNLAAMAVGQAQFGLDKTGRWPVILGVYSVVTLGLSLWRNRASRGVRLQ